MKARKYFPLGKAYGEAFCNRVEETKWLVGNINNSKHSLLIAPRRYGKSSLAENAIARTKIPSIKINFHLCTTEEEVSQIIINNVNKLIAQSIGPIENIINSIKKYVSNLNPKISFGEDIATLELVPKQHINQSVIISETLLLLEKLLLEHNKKAIIFFDEFQEIGKITKNSSIEGAIRTAAQEMQQVSIIFSGSIRTLLLRMFNDEQRPLYKLCRKLTLERIAESHYQKHINAFAIKTWGKPLDNAVISEIMKLSGRHPYYVNYLCDVVWGEEKYPSTKNIKEAWLVIVNEEWSDALREISTLSSAQKKVLKYIAQNNLANIMTQEISSQIQMPVSTISSALDVLIEKDYVEVDQANHYKIINPILHAVLDNTK